MEKQKINFIIDAFLLLGGAALAGIGFLMKFVLLPGKERMAVYGRNVELTFLGLDRHDWGAVHLWIAYVLMILLALHLGLHLNWIVTMIKKWTLKSKAQRVAVVCFFVLCLGLLLFAFVISPEVIPTGGGERGYGFGKGAGRGVVHGKVSSER